jgi:hypothetical protein
MAPPNNCRALAIDFGKLIHAQEKAELLSPGPEKTAVQKLIKQEITNILEEMRAEHCFQ